MSPKITFDVVEGDALKYQADVLALKYAQGLYGADRAAVLALNISESALAQKLAVPGNSCLINSQGRLAPARVLFVGVRSLYAFRYGEIRQFAEWVLAHLKEQAPKTSHLAVTIHGVNYGLDELEAFTAQLNGFLDGLRSAYPPALERITFVEWNSRRAEFLRNALSRFFSKSLADSRPQSVAVQLDGAAAERLPSAGKNSEEKPHVFVAIPFTEEFENVYYYGIENPVKEAGFLCERVDVSVFQGDIVDQIKRRIETAAVVIADLSTANPNVYLEVGYAWGRNRPTILLVRDPDELKFDVKAQRCLVYGKSIRKLENGLRKELTSLKLQK